jgi:hypothetical protein
VPKGTCAVENCDRPSDSRGWCRAHYERWRTTGDVDASRPVVGKVPRPPGAQCTVEGCDRPPGGREWCGMHYKRWLKHGDPLFVPDPWPTKCSTEDCDKKPVARGLCEAHYAKLRRYGDVEWHRPLLPNDRVNYFGLHARLRQSRGSATAHRCVGKCGRQARHWAWLHGEDPCDFRNYVPMCFSCHLRYDRYSDADAQPWGIGLTPRRPRRRASGPPLPVLLAAPTD